MLPQSAFKFGRFTKNLGKLSGHIVRTSSTIYNESRINFPCLLDRLRYTGWPKKVSYYRESSLNRIKNRQPGYIFHQFWLQNEQNNITCSN